MPNKDYSKLNPMKGGRGSGDAPVLNEDGRLGGSRQDGSGKNASKEAINGGSADIGSAKQVIDPNEGAPTLPSVGGVAED